MVYNFSIDCEGVEQREFEAQGKILSACKSFDDMGDYFIKDYTDWYGIENYDVMVYTQFKDINDKEIFEGDLLKLTLYDKDLGKKSIEIHEVKYIDNDWMLEKYYKLRDVYKTSEVIGHKYNKKNIKIKEILK